MLDTQSSIRLVGKRSLKRPYHRVMECGYLPLASILDKHSHAQLLVWRWRLPIRGDEAAEFVCDMNNRHIRSDKTDFHVFRFEHCVFRSRLENRVEALFSTVPAYSHFPSDADEI